MQHPFDYAPSGDDPQYGLPPGAVDWPGPGNPAGAQLGPIVPLETLQLAMHPMHEMIQRTAQSVETLAQKVEVFDARLEAIERALRDDPGGEGDDEREGEAQLRPKKRLALPRRQRQATTSMRNPCATCR